ncbi:MAG: hypothetical protein I3274_04450 [Candidatus Moeniiplasma glomeromycotorum]|nr:hypothetical protein [Candidatus Moeniiplasma glomeromycotorum]
MADNQKEYIKKFIIRVVKGKVKSEEMQKIRKNLLNMSQEEWKDLIILGKQLSKEFVSEELNKADSSKLPSEWKETGRDLCQALVNFIFAIFNEKVFYESMQLEKQSGLDNETKIIKILPVIAEQMDKMADRVPQTRPKNYYKVEKSLIKKIKPLISDIEIMFYSGFMGVKDLEEEQIKSKVSKWVNVLESLSVEEIAVFKDKIKLFLTKVVDKYAPPQIKNSPEIRKFIDSAINLWCASMDEKLAKDSWNMAAKVVRLALQNEGQLKGKSFMGGMKQLGMEQELKGLIRGNIQHLNKLAGEGKQNNRLSAEKEQNIVQKLTEDNPNLEGEEGDTNLGNIFADNALTKGFDNSTWGGDLENSLTGQDLFKEFKDTVTTMQSKPKWYQSAWFITLAIIVALVAGGLVVWLLMRNKKEKKVIRNREIKFE